MQTRGWDPLDANWDRILSASVPVSGNSSRAEGDWPLLYSIILGLDRSAWMARLDHLHCTSYSCQEKTGGIAALLKS